MGHLTDVLIQAPPAAAFGITIHEQITFSALPFFGLRVFRDIEDEHAQMDGGITEHQQRRS